MYILFRIYYIYSIYELFSQNFDQKITAFDTFVEKSGLDKKPHQRNGVQ